jgi:CyaY protein
MNDQEFRDKSEKALKELDKALLQAGDRYGFETDNNQGALVIEFEDPPARFVVSPNSPVRQIWVSARVKSFKLDWDDSTSEFVLAGRNLRQLLSDLITEQLGEPVSL